MADITGMLQAAAGAGGAEETDPNFNQTVLLLHGDGTNGAQNNTFLDSSTNNFTITRNGNTTQGTFSPFSVADGAWSNYFDGSGDYISVPDSADFTMGSGDFTIQCWVYSTANSGSDQYILGQVPSTGAGASTSFQLYKKATTNVAEAYVYIGGAKVATSTATIPVGVWTHLAMVRDGGTMRLYVNGTQDGTNATLSTSSIVDSTGSFAVGRTGDYNGLYFSGYVSNVSVVKGTCLFPNGTSFTPSTSPLSTSTSGQSVLLCTANRFVDANTATTAKTVTVGGNTSVQPFSPFAPTAAYSPTTNGGSGYFDGVTDYLYDNTLNTAYDFGSGDFTIECWLYPRASGIQMMFVNYTPLSGSPAATAFSWFFRITSGNKLSFTLYSSSTGYVVEDTTNMTLNAWTHVAVTRESGEVRLFRNGAIVDSDTFNVSINSSDANRRLQIGTYNLYGQTDEFNGYMSDVRIVNGAAEYTAAFTPPTAPLTAVSGTSLLCNFTNAGILDNTGKNNLETVGNAQIDTTTKKFGTGSMEFDGTGDWLFIPSTPDLNLGTGNATIECWLYITAAIQDYRMIVSENSTNNYVTLRGGGTGGRIEINVAGTSFTIDLNNSISQNTWHHLAVVRSGSTFTAYVDGASLGTGTSSAAWNYSTNGAFVGRFGTTAYEWPGFIDDLRISRVARYLTSFTPPDKAFPDQ